MGGPKLAEFSKCERESAKAQAMDTRTTRKEKKMKARARPRKCKKDSDLVHIQKQPTNQTALHIYIETTVPKSER